MMTRNQSWLRRLCPLLLAGCLLSAPATTSTVFAQPPAPAGEEEEKSEGRPLDGYLLMVMLASLAFFVVGKTARR